MLKDHTAASQPTGTPTSEMDVIFQEGLLAKVTKQDERRHYLGELRERVLRALDLKQVKSEKVYPEILAAIKDPRASHVLIHQSIPIKLGSRYEKPARERGLRATYVNDPAFRGSIGLVVAAKDAVDVQDIAVAD